MKSKKPNPEMAPEHAAELLSAAHVQWEHGIVTVPGAQEVLTPKEITFVRRQFTLAIEAAKAGQLDRERFDLLLKLRFDRAAQSPGETHNG